jgi:hypothetical protein
MERRSAEVIKKALSYIKLIAIRFFFPDQQQSAASLCRPPARR